jgi:hypothetical protein
MNKAEKQRLYRQKCGETLKQKKERSRFRREKYSDTNKEAIKDHTSLRIQGLRQKRKLESSSNFILSSPFGSKAVETFSGTQSLLLMNMIQRLNFSSDTHFTVSVVKCSCQSV